MPVRGGFNGQYNKWGQICKNRMKEKNTKSVLLCGFNNQLEILVWWQNNHWCKIETGFLCGEGARVILFVALVIQQLGFLTQNVQANVDYCYVRRRAECTSLCAGLQHRSLRSNSSLAAKRRAEALHVVFFFNKASAPSTRAPAALCVLSHDT